MKEKNANANATPMPRKPPGAAPLSDAPASVNGCTTSLPATPPCSVITTSSKSRLAISTSAKGPMTHTDHCTSKYASSQTTSTLTMLYNTQPPGACIPKKVDRLRSVKPPKAACEAASNRE